MDVMIAPVVRDAEVTGNTSSASLFDDLEVPQRLLYKAKVFFYRMEAPRY
jgi:hypothetical protein